MISASFDAMLRPPKDVDLQVDFWFQGGGGFVLIFWNVPWGIDMQELKTNP